LNRNISAPGVKPRPVKA